MLNLIALSLLAQTDLSRELGAQKLLYEISSVSLHWDHPKFKAKDRNSWVFLPFDRVKGSVDLSHSYATSWLQIKLRGKPGHLALSFWDSHNQNGNPVSIADKGVYDSAKDTWFVPMGAATDLRMDLVGGIAVGEMGKPEGEVPRVEGPIRLISTGRIDDRPLDVSPQATSVRISIHPDQVVKDLAHYGFGCHWDYAEGMPGSEAFKAPISFYKDMGFNMVRTGTPLVPADDRQAQLDEIPKHEWAKLQPLPFTDLVSLFQQANLNQIAVILPFNEYFKLPEPRPSLAEWSHNVPTGPKYLAGKKFFKDSYYELGNEIWSKDNKMGGAATGANGEYIGPAIPDAVHLYSTWVKSADPHAKFMASYAGFDSSWPYLMKVLPDLDVINFSFYGWEESYEKFRNGTTLPIGAAEKKLEETDPVAASRILFGATEYAPHDWAPEFEGKGWTTVNDLGHSLRGFAQAAESLADPKMAFACQWTVRWIWEHEDRQTGKKVWAPDDIYPGDDWDLLRVDRRRTALADALKLLGRNRLDEVVASECSESPQILTVATRSRDRKRLNVFILNKDYGTKSIRLDLGKHPKSARAQIFTGHGLNDPSPSLGPLRPVGTDGSRVSLNAPELSITLIEISM